MKEKTETYIQALQAALHEQQLRDRNEIERLTMIINDHESQELNKVLEEQALESCVREAQGDILNLKDAKHKIHVMV